LFHYRNYGGDIGKVLVAFHVGSDGAMDEDLSHFLERLNFPYVDETDNPVYKKLLL